MCLTNVNFNEEKHFLYLGKLAEKRDHLKKLYEDATEASARDAYLLDPQSPSSFVYKANDKQYLFAESRKVGI